MSDEFVVTSFVGGGLLEQEMPEHEPLLEATDSKFDPPEHVDNRWLCTDADDQGQEPRCAIETVCEMLEVRNWQNDGYRTVYADEFKRRAYNLAKKSDGMPNQDGTTLSAAAKAVLSMVNYNNGLYTIKHLRGQDELRYAMVKYQTVAVGLKIYEDWNHCNPKTGFIRNEGGEYLGGHAVLTCAYSFLDDPWYGIKNWWKGWGWSQGRLKGFGRMTEAQMMDNLMDAIVIREL